MIPKFRIHGDGAELVPYTVPELFFFAGGRTLCFDAARGGRDEAPCAGTTKSNYYM